MDVADRLSRELLRQDFAPERPHTEETDRYREAARNYALLENTLVVLSDLRTNRSRIFHGGFSRTLGVGVPGSEQCIDSIWERSILERIHPDDLHGKYLQEQHFFRLVKRLPRQKRFDYQLLGRLRMRDLSGNYLPVLHRMRYLPGSTDGDIRQALCLYQPLPFELPGCGIALDTATGRSVELQQRDEVQLLSPREAEVLRLIEQGMTSKQIAQALCISIHTVSRHRQEILSSLRVRNSVEACRLARELGLL